MGIYQVLLAGGESDELAGYLPHCLQVTILGVVLQHQHHASHLLLVVGLVLLVLPV